MRGTPAIVACLASCALVADCAQTPGGATASSPNVHQPSARPGSDGAGGATDSLSGDLAERQQFADLAAMLQGRVPGLQVIRLNNGDISLRIRGTSSLSQDDPTTGRARPEGEPLVVVDGMSVQPGNLSRVLRSLDPHEVSSIRVLKDVASTSAYGMRGAYGVVVIETKR
jgi:TonB-dependent SusC/RagA subfamily outer membrane receptor